MTYVRFSTIFVLVSVVLFVGLDGGVAGIKLSSHPTQHILSDGHPTIPVKITELNDAATQVKSPGLKVALNQRIFDYVEKIVTPALINSLLSKFSIPTINVTKDDVQVTISQIRLGNVNFSPASVAFTSNGISFRISGATAGVTLSWSYLVEYVDLGDSGTGNIVVGDIEFDLVIIVGEANGHPTLQVGGLDFKLGDLDITLHGGASWFYSLFVSLFNSLIVSEIQSAVSNAVTQGINVQANALLQTLPTIVKLPPQQIAEVNVSLVSPPTFVAGYSATVGIDGTVTPSGSSQMPPYVPAVLPDSLDNEMIQVILGKYVLESAAWAYFQTGLLSYLVTPNMIPGWFPVQLNTTTWKFLIPALYNKYPNEAMNLHFFVSSVPTINFNPGSKYKGVGVDVQADFDVNVITKDNKVLTVFDLAVDLKLDFVIEFNASVVHGQFYFVEFNVTIKNSTIGTFDVSIIEFVLNFVVNTLILQPLNAFLASVGIAIPTVDGITLATPTITYNNGYIGFTTDLKIVPPAS